MKDFDKYLQRSKRIADSARNSGNGFGFFVAWSMIVVGVVVTGVQTHSLAYNGMRGSNLYKDWLDFAAWLPVILLEGTAVGLILGRLYFFKGSEQRRVGFIASFIIWGVLAFNTIAVFVTGTLGDIPAPLLFYVRYILPFSIVAAPYLWKWLLDLHPDSQERIATLEVEAEYDQQWRTIQREQNAQIIATYRDAQESPEVRNAVERLAKKAALKRATQIVGAIGETVDELDDDFRDAVGEQPRPQPRQLRQPQPGERIRWQGNSAFDANGEEIDASVLDRYRRPQSH